MTIKPLVELLAVKKKQEAKRSINEEIHTQVPVPQYDESDTAESFMQKDLSLWERALVEA